jgi:uncharacterized protein involved in exopolysaccharide biosynthesis
MQDVPEIARQTPPHRLPDSNAAFTLIWRARYWVIGAILALGLAAYAIAPLLPERYMGSTLIQVGSIPVGEARDEIEQPRVAASRFGSTPFKIEILEAAGLPVDGSDPDARLAMDTLSANSRPVSSSIEVQVVATSPERVVQILDAAAPVLAKVHQAIAEPRLQALREQIESVHAELADVDRIGEQQILPDEAGGYAVAARHLFSLYEKSHLKALERQLSEKLTLFEPTRAVTAPSVLPRPLGPRRFLYAAIAMVVACVLLATLILLLAPANAPRDRHL